MRASELEQVKARLQRRRRVILTSSLRAGVDIDQLRASERDPEVVEASQREQQEFDVSSLGEIEQAEIAQIDAALQRLDAGKYGTCLDCGEEIASERLAAVPFAALCADCASSSEAAAKLRRELAGRPRTMTPEDR